MRFRFFLPICLILLSCSDTDLGGGIQVDGGGITETPVVASTSPASPALTQTPEVVGTSEADATITIFSDSGCSTQVASGTADSSGAFSVSLSSAMDGGTTSTFFARALASGKSLSECSSSSVSFRSTAIRPGLALLTGTQTTAPSAQTELNQATAFAMEWSTSEVDSTYYSHSTSTNSETITIQQPGDYLVAATLPMTMTAGTFRPCVRMEIRVNGTLVPGAIGESSYIRFDATGNLQSSSHVTQLLRGLSASDTVEVFVQETAGEDGTETVSVTNIASLYLEYVSASRSLFTASATRTVASTNINGASSAFEWSEDRTTTDVTHSDGVNPQDITLTAGTYMLYVNIPINSTSARASPRVLVRLNGVTVNGGQASQGYMRVDSGHNDASVHWSGHIVASGGDTLTITSEQEAAGGTVIVQATTVASLTLEKLSSATGTISVRGTALVSGTDWNPGAASSIVWDNMDIHDVSAYTHSTSSNEHQITVSDNGDYLLVYNDSMTSTAQRPNPIIRVQVNGTDVTGAETKTHYIRSDSGHNESSASLVFLLRNLSASDIVSVTSQLETQTGTVNDVEEALLTLIKK